MITLVLVGAGVVFCCAMGVMVVRYVPYVRNHAFFRFLAQIDTGSIKVVWVTYQIIASTSFNLDIKVQAHIRTPIYIYALNDSSLMIFSASFHNVHYSNNNNNNNNKLI
jgi:hypothetical protein